MTMPIWNGTDPAASAATAASLIAGVAYKSGWWIGTPCSSIGTGVPTINTALMSPVTIPKACTVDRISAEVTTLAASSAVRLGIYASDENGMPSALVLDAGTIDGTSTGIKNITIDQDLAAGNYWLCSVAQGGTPTMRVNTGGLSVVFPDTTIGISTPATYPGITSVASNITGALPATIVPSYAVQPPRVLLRFV